MAVGDAFREGSTPPRGVPGVRNTNAPAAPTTPPVVRPPVLMPPNTGGRPRTGPSRFPGTPPTDVGMGDRIEPAPRRVEFPQDPIGDGLTEALENVQGLTSTPEEKRANRYAGLPPTAKVRSDGVQKEGRASKITLNAKGQKRYGLATAKLRERYGYDPFRLEEGAPQPDLVPGGQNYNPFSGEWVSEE